jgi:outer membrane murein-binding lipoprotein Lpp
MKKTILTISSIILTITTMFSGCSSKQEIKKETPKSLSDQKIVSELIEYEVKIDKHFKELEESTK